MRAWVCTGIGVQVREQANSTLVTIYCHVGERIRNDLEKKGVPAAR